MSSPTPTQAIAEARADGMVYEDGKWFMPSIEDDTYFMDEKINGKWERVRIVCEHMCTSNCRREGCNCNCGEYHEITNEPN